MSLNRLGTANMYDRTINNIMQRRSELENQMEKASAGKRVLRPSDDPVAAAQAERARTRLERIDNDSRALTAQTATMRYAESTMGEIYGAVQSFRSHLVNAGNGAYTQEQRDALAQQMQSLRDQVLNYVNRTDSNGLPLFRGLDTKGGVPFPDGKDGIQSGQTNAGEFNIPNSLDGVMAFFSIPKGNGVLSIERDENSLGAFHTSVGAVRDASLANGLMPPNEVTVKFEAGDPAILTEKDKFFWQVTGEVDAAGSLITPQQRIEYDPSKSGNGQIIRVQGMEITIKGVPLKTVDGTPTGEVTTNGKIVPGTDTFTIKPTATSATSGTAETTNLFEIMDDAIAAVKEGSKATSNSTDFGKLSQHITASLADLDNAMGRVSTVRSLAGDLLNQADMRQDTLLARSEQMETLRSNAEDMDSVKGYSDLMEMNTQMSAALQTYGAIQKLSLFDYIR